MDQGASPATSMAVAVPVGGDNVKRAWFCVPRSGFVNERQRDALQRGRTSRELELAADALRELTLDARGFSRRARRVLGQALELSVQRLRVLPVLLRECRAAVYVHG